jgi:hypothetical protein
MELTFADCSNSTPDCLPPAVPNVGFFPFLKQDGDRSFKGLGVCSERRPLGTLRADTGPPLKKEAVNPLASQSAGGGGGWQTCINPPRMADRRPLGKTM